MFQFVSKVPTIHVQGFHWEEKQDSGRFLSAAEEAFKELKVVPRKFLIADKIPVWNSESKQQWEEMTLRNTKFPSSPDLENKTSCLSELYNLFKTHCPGLNTGGD